MLEESVDGVSPGKDVKEFTSFASDIDLVAATNCLITPRRPARAITIVTAGGGNLSIKVAAHDTTRNLTGLTDGEHLEPIQIRKILTGAGTDVTKVRVYW